MAKYLKPQTPLQHYNGDYIYPITSADQVIVSNGERLNANLINIDLNNSDNIPENVLKPQNPMIKGSDYFYPLTTSDQVIMPDGTRLDTENIGGMKMELLWENASPTSEFVAQTVTIDLSGYRSLLVQFRTYNEHSSVFCDVDLSLYQVWYNTTGTSSFLTIRRRDFTISTDGIAFSGAYEATNAKAEWASNRSLVPVRIYGIK